MTLRLTAHRLLLFLALGAWPRLASTAEPDLSKLEAFPPASVQSVDFEKDIQPLLARRCHGCHGPEKQKGGLRLDRREDVLAGGDSGPALVPKQSAGSHLIHLVAGLEPDSVMPPKGERLSAAEIGLLRAWIDLGADWPTNSTLPSPGVRSSHWSFQPPQKQTPPEVQNKSWARNSVDAFILARLEKEKTDPSPEADRSTLIRRLSLDLTGLPPSPEEAKAFAENKDPAAYERLVERLLGSPHFGEQWARHWLDLARYADSDGYEKDFYRPHAWRWRDWVINSINRDQPFDEFTRDQLAGDLLPQATLEQRVATGFHRNTLLNREGGVDIEEDRAKNVVDRISTVGTAWLGLTVGCAECHSHKYDPISQKEFYQLYSFFNSTDDRDIKAPLPREASALEQKESAYTTAKRRYVSAPDPEMEAWAERAAALPDIWQTPKVEDYELPTFGANNGANLYPQEDGSFLVTGMIENKTHYIMMLNTRLQGITGIRVEALTDEMLPRLGPGWSSGGNFVLTELHTESASLQAVSDLKTSRVDSVFADYSQDGFPIAEAIDGVTTNGGWAVDLPGLPMHGVDRCAVFILDEPIRHDDGTRLKVSLVQHFGKSHTLGRVRVTYTTESPEKLPAHTVPQTIKEIARLPAARRSLDQQVTLKRYFEATFRQQSPALAEFSQAMLDSPGVKGETQAQTLAERSQPRATFVHVRGNFLDKGAAVAPGVPAVLHPFHPDAARPAPNRLDLANWINDPANPLTARVTVNHIWSHLFGEGLVPTMADFGTQGDLPSHPELLDWLCSEFARLNWSRKALIQLIVTSAAYRQSSAVREDLLERDAKNRWLARQNRFRLSAENARDQQLAASGLLDSSIGGPSVTPKSSRRGLYLQFKRSFPEYMLTTFDAPGSTIPCPKRERSNTPLQALTLMNDESYLRCARALAAQTLASTAEEAIQNAFQRCFARQPGEAEVKRLSTLLESLRAIYEKDREAARKLAVLKEDAADAPERAARIALARTILNLDELMTRE